MILVIDTSAATAAVALIDTDKGGSEDFTSTRADLLSLLRRIARSTQITKVAVATGPGSFTGLRAGVSFGLGLAKGLGVPIVPLPTLVLQAARTDAPVTAVAEAGRGRFYYLAPGAEMAVGGPADIPTTHPLVGGVPQAALLAAGHSFVPEHELRPFGQAAAKMLETAGEVPYGSLEIEYMQTLFLPTKSEPSA